MKILLLGEFSGLHKYHKDGLKQFATEVSLLTNGDTWKKIDAANDYLYKNEGNIFKRLYGTTIEPFKNARRFYGFDVVQFIKYNNVLLNY